ncbi:MAG: hypothetical protein C0506_03770 [Anaerolinea sp.]|nr:hypothetical protein [Anaerolinea sp.]
MREGPHDGLIWSLQMEDSQPPGLRQEWLARRSTRRALLAGGAAVAAAGTAAVVVGVAARDTSPAGATATPAGGPASQAATQAAAETPRLARVMPEPRRRAAHLLRRAGFGGTAAQIDEFAGLSREDAADRLLNYETIDNSALDARLAAATFDPIRPGDNVRWWYTRLLYTARPLEERMTFLWHGLLTSQVSKIGPQRSKLMLAQNQLFRTHALGKFDDLLQAVSKDPAMLVYLDTVDSTKEHPNENYARELMELFSMGVGNYTEDDIREAARAFTGWRITNPDRPARPVEGLSEEERRKLLDEVWRSYEPKFIVNQRLHDSGSKTFLGRTGNFGGEEIVSIILEQPATGRYITARLFSEFAYPDPDQETVDRLVKVWDESAHSIKAVVREILTSDEFYSERAYRSLVRCPVTFLVNAVRGLEIGDDLRPNMFNDKYIKGMDQVLFEPPNVAGWPGRATWLSSGTFFARVNFLDQFLMGQRARPLRLPALDGATTPETLVDRALSIFVDGNVPAASRQSIIDYAATLSNPQQRASAVAYLALASPEYQLI